MSDRIYEGEIDFWTDRGNAAGFGFVTVREANGIADGGEMMWPFSVLKPKPVPVVIIRDRLGRQIDYVEGWNLERKGLAVQKLASRGFERPVS